MTYLQIDNISKNFGDLVLFENISFQLSEGQKIALVARNGAGKTTLFNILSGKDTSNEGEIKFHKNISIGFLEQEPSFDKDKTVLQQVFSSSGEIMQAVAEYEDSLRSGDLERMHRANLRMDALNAWNYEAKIKQILSSLKIETFDKKMSELSGGQRKRVALANALISEPDLLILDEPTNHLDLDMIEWLEDYLSRTSLTLFMVTHDRYFLDRVCNYIIEIDNKQLYKYQGNYTDFLIKRDERLANESANTEKARNLLRKELDWIRRMPKARTGKSKSRIDAFFELKDKATVNHEVQEINLNVKASRLGTKTIEIKHLCKSFNAIQLLKDFSYNFVRYEKVGIIGNNGTGKTTFLNLIAGLIKPDSGRIETGETVRLGYYKQDGISFDETKKVIDLAQDIAEVVDMGKGNKINASQFLNYFLFPPETQQTYVYKLSGGEKRRLYLATVLMQNPNFLILDEPTNDLDILTLNVLEDYLREFNGCVIIVSHDRYFMDKIINHVFVFKGNGEIKDFPGNYSIYRSKSISEQKQTSAPAKAEAKEKYKNTSTQKKKLSFKEQKEFESLENEIDMLEKEYKSLEESLFSGNLSGKEVNETSVRMSEIHNAIEEKTERWIQLSS